jgi:hypothetical protein
VFVSKRIPFVNAAMAILTLHLNSYRVLSDVRTARAECQGIASDILQMAERLPAQKTGGLYKTCCQKGETVL